MTDAPATHVRFTWQPDDSDAPETLTAYMTRAHAAELRDLIADPAALGEAVMWIPTLLDSEPMGAPFRNRLFRVARITHVDIPED